MNTLRFCAALCLLLALPALAQPDNLLTPGLAVDGAVTDANPAPTYVVDAQAGQVVTLRLTAAPELRPVVLVADSANTVIDTILTEGDDTIINRVITFPTTDRYFIQVQGLRDTRGTFALVLLEGDVPLTLPEDSPTHTPTPTPTDVEAPPTVIPLPEATAEATPAAPMLVRLALGTTDVGELAAGGTRLYRVEVADAALLRIESGALAALQDAVTGGVLATLDGTRIAAGAFDLTAGTYTLILDHAAGTTPAAYRVALLAAQSAPEAAAAAPTAATVIPTLPPTPTLLPTATAIPEVDLLLRWSATAFTLTNVTDAPLNVRPLAFTGANRTVDVTYWQNSNPALNLSALGSRVCLGLRPLAYPDAPALPPNCDDLGGWWSADVVYFWESDDFTVTYNGAVLTTCLVADGQCSVDLPE